MQRLRWLLALSSKWWPHASVLHTPAAYAFTHSPWRCLLQEEQRQQGQYTATQAKLIKRRMRAYYHATRAVAGYRFSWKDVTDVVFDLTKVRFKGDSLRAIVTGQVSRGKPRSGGQENLEAIVRFLADPDIKGLELRELDEPHIPYLLVMQLLEFLQLNVASEAILPPPTVEGAYRAVHRSEDGVSEIDLELTFSNDGRFFHLEQSSATYRGIDGDPADLSEHQRKKCLWRKRLSYGWGIFTPEENFLGFLKRLSKYGENQYYYLIACKPRPSEDTVEDLVLQIHEEPYFGDEEQDDQLWSENVRQSVVRDSLRYFVRKGLE